ncbi:PREDICTED: GTP-binding protein 2 [Nicrophorus vespilloides]|uniref:GTP-binding protein 2 n=1 Tax=Nicrophorus vespilloides TaxID=110193 RepID=A0ABM1NA21_NICVS|nr:PREDICTED: GTP-binding protein 2 [Nicrophorus vespilloides]XP_017783670.1 PREDICTED: GTP-binding protein 2 [Nicrophorus vespilloides]XP_017783671.1 PREDICTED: GTP-binding protein 2 [Nicrophorus vespilloides]
MDLMNLFGSSLEDIGDSIDHTGLFHPTSLPPEPQVGNIEYKLKIVNPSRQRFQHLVTQMKWRLREGQGEAIYEIGVEDNGMLAGLSNADMKDSLHTLEQMAIKLGASTTILRQRVLDNHKNVCEVLVRKIPDDQNNIEIRIAVLGNADAGKSTLLGVLTQGSPDNGRGRARLNMFRHKHEIQSGRTSSISHEILGFNSKGDAINYDKCMTAEEICDESTKLVTFLDLAGHRKYIHTTVHGLSGYLPHHAMLVVSGTAGVVGMTQEHLSLAIALNVPFFIVVTKIDLTYPHKTLESLQTLLKLVGSCRRPLVVNNIDDVVTACSNQLSQNIVPIFCVSNVTGEGLNLLLKFMYALPPGVSSKEKELLEKEKPEFQIDENFHAGDIQVMGGLLVKGIISEGMKMKLGPMKNGSFEDVVVKSIHRNRVHCRSVRAGQSAAISLTRQVNHLRNGMVLLQQCDENITGCLFFQANVSVLFHATAIYPSFQTTVHIGSIRQTATVIGIFGADCIQTNDRASIVFKFKSHPEHVTVGQRLFFREGTAKGIGEVTQVFPLPITQT